jgi:hypothetical protein
MEEFEFFFLHRIANATALLSIGQMQSATTPFQNGKPSI